MRADREDPGPPVASRAPEVVGGEMLRCFPPTLLLLTRLIAAPGRLDREVHAALDDVTVHGYDPAPHPVHAEPVDRRLPPSILSAGKRAEFTRTEGDRMFFELRQYHIRPGQQANWVKCMEEEIIPFQVKMGMVILGSFVGEEDASVYVWIRRFESEAERKRLYDAVYQSDYWKNEIAPEGPDHDRSRADQGDAPRRDAPLGDPVAPPRAHRGPAAPTRTVWTTVFTLGNCSSCHAMRKLPSGAAVMSGSQALMAVDRVWTALSVRPASVV